jgi:hypothetical protein
MRSTCIQCSYQIPIACSEKVALLSSLANSENCSWCGQVYPFDMKIFRSVFPSEEFEETHRAKIFHAAGIITNWGMIAQYWVLWGALFFPLSLVGALLGAYTAMLPLPEGRYHGAAQGQRAFFWGMLVFTVQSALLWLIWGSSSLS